MRSAWRAREAVEGNKGRERAIGEHGTPKIKQTSSTTAPSWLLRRTARARAKADAALQPKLGLCVTRPHCHSSMCVMSVALLAAFVAERCRATSAVFERVSDAEESRRARQPIAPAERRLLLVPPRNLALRLCSSLDCASGCGGKRARRCPVACGCFAARHATCSPPGVVACCVCLSVVSLTRPLHPIRGFLRRGRPWWREATAAPSSPVQPRWRTCAQPHSKRQRGRQERGTANDEGGDSDELGGTRRRRSALLCSARLGSARLWDEPRRAARRPDSGEAKGEGKEERQRRTRAARLLESGCKQISNWKTSPIYTMHAKQPRQSIHNCRYPLF